MGNIWKDKRKCKGFPEMYRAFEMHDQTYKTHWLLMARCMHTIACYGQRYGRYFSPEFVVHCRRYGDPFQNVRSANMLFPSGCTFNEYLYGREVLSGQIVIDLDSDLDENAPPISLSE